MQCDTWLWDDMPLNSSKRPPYWNSTYGFDFDHHRRRHVILHQPAKFYPNRTTHGIKMRLGLYRFSKWQISAILDFMGPIMGSLKSPCTTSYRSSIETMALNCLVFEKIAFLHFGNRQTDRQTNKQTDWPVTLSRSHCRERQLNKPHRRFLSMCWTLPVRHIEECCGLGLAPVQCHGNTVQ